MPRLKRTKKRVELPREVWELIFPYLAKPIPAPLSCPPRSEMRQNDLVSLSYTCRVTSHSADLWSKLMLQLFAEIAHPLLYTHIYTDSLSYLFWEIDQPDMQRRFARTKSLRIEYSEKGQDARYRNLLEVGGSAWQIMGRTMFDMRLSVNCQCEEETEGIYDALVTVNKVGMKRAFPKLATVAIASIYGTNADPWFHYAAECDSRGQLHPSTPTTKELDKFLASGTLRSFCLRDCSGPLSILPIKHASDPATPKARYEQIVHFAEDVKHLPLPLGQKIKWVSEVPRHRNWAPVSLEISECIYQLVMVRKELVERDGKRPDTADIEIYCTTRLYQPVLSPNLPLNHPYNVGAASHTSARSVLSAEMQKEKAQGMGEVLQSVLRQHSGLQDEVRWYRSMDWKGCPACSSEIPE